MGCLSDKTQEKRCNCRARCHSGHSRKIAVCSYWTGPTTKTLLGRRRSVNFLLTPSRPVFVCICSPINSYSMFNRFACRFISRFDEPHTKPNFWLATDSPRLYVSTNPWKITATFQTIASTREEYMFAIANLQASAPPPARGRDKRSKLQQSHLALITALESRVEAIDAELTVSKLIPCPIYLYTAKN